jgi:cyclopropane fatty-acyl-phospholipid synthase-like methyltransferase
MLDKINRLEQLLLGKIFHFLFVDSAWEDWYRRKNGAVEPEIPKLEELFRSNGVRRILDFGCGVGRHAVYFAKRGFEVYGFDQSQKALRQAESTLVSENLSAHLRLWNMIYPLPYETDFFDAVLAVRVIQHTYKKNIENILREIDRVLRDRGFVFMQVTCYDTEMQCASDKQRPRWVEPRTLISWSGTEKGVPRHLFTKEELLSMLKGYEILEIHSGTDHYSGHCIIARKPEHPL